MATASTLDADDARDRLRELGQRRAELDAEDQDLTKEIRDALAEVAGVIPATEEADLLGVHRTTLYRVYKPKKK